MTSPTFLLLTDDLCDPGSFMDSLSPDTRRRATTIWPRCSYPGCDQSVFGTDIYCESCREATDAEDPRDAIGDHQRQLKLEDEA